MVSVLRVKSGYWRKFDWWLIIFWAVLVSLGLLTIGGIGELGRPFFNRQIFFALFSLVFLMLSPLVDYRIFKNYSLAAVFIYALALVLLLTSLGSQTIRGINAWIILGAIRLEPSELAKLAVIILLAKYFSQKHTEIYRIHHLVASGLYMALPASLVLLQPDLGSAFIFFLIWLAILLVTGVQRRHLMMILMVMVIAAVMGWLVFLQPYQKNRITSFINPYLDPKGEGYSIIQAKTAIGSGQWLGNGWGQGTQARFGFLPEAHTDFVFASYAEQFGWLGVLGLFGALWGLLWRIGKIGFNARNNFARLFSVGLMTFIFSHVLVNAGMNLGLLPITGISFPFLSYGGSFLIALTLGLGLIQGIKIRHGF